MKTNYHGLSSLEVQEKISKGLTNHILEEQSKTYRSIIFQHTFTLFNAINIVLAILVMYTKAFSNMLFMGVVFFNTVIGIFQEIRAKKKLDQLKFLNQSHYLVIRDSQETSVNSNQIVLDDIMHLTAGQQVPSDAIILDGVLELNEALLTGESDIILKTKKDKLYSGSFITSGDAIVQVIHVGKDNYIQSLLIQAKTHKKHPSMLKDALNLIIKTITFIIFPIGLLLFMKQFFITSLSLNESILSTVAALIGMIPEGLILLTSVSLALGAISLTRKNTLTQELYSLETLARVDMLCLDKTGTLTKGVMKVDEIVSFQDMDLSNILANMMNDLKDDNATASAITSYCQINQKFEMLTLSHFSSDRKSSSVHYKGQGNFILGAYQFLNVHDKNIEKEIHRYTSNGKRVLVLLRQFNDKSSILGLIILSDQLRETAFDTLQYFKKQNVAIKIISGDDARTVSAIAKQAGLDNANKAIDVYDLNDAALEKVTLTHQVFGRVKPDQKQKMIQTLINHGYTTAMVGDGVNDVMALKTADCSIAMKDGSDAAKNISNLILLDNDFSNMPYVVQQGRRVINNIQRTATLFLSKTVFSVFLSFLTLFFISEYPFYPIQLTLISNCFIGIPAFFLSLESNDTKVQGNFLANILSKAIPCGLSIVISIIFYQLLMIEINISSSHLSTMIVYNTMLCLGFTLISMMRPFNLYRSILLLSIIIIAFVCTQGFSHFFLIEPLFIEEYLIVGVISFFSIFSLILLDKLKLSNYITKFINS